MTCLGTQSKTGRLLPVTLELLDIASHFGCERVWLQEAAWVAVGAVTVWSVLPKSPPPSAGTAGYVPGESPAV